MVVRDLRAGIRRCHDEGARDSEQDGCYAMNQAAQIQWVPLAAGKKKKLKKPSARDALDKLIDWYEKNKPDHPKQLPGGVAIKPTTLDRRATPQGDKQWMYRGWLLTLAEIPPKGREKQKIRK
jgi:hypothetical protein